MASATDPATTGAIPANDAERQIRRPMPFDGARFDVEGAADAMETRSPRRSFPFLLLTVLAVASWLPAQGATRRTDYLPHAICAQLGDVRARVLGSDGHLYLMLNPRLSGPEGRANLGKEMSLRHVPKEIVAALTDPEGPESNVSNLGHCAKNMVKAFLEQFLNNVEAIDTLEAITGRTPGTERRKALLVIVDAGMQTDAKGTCEAVISLRLVRLQIGPTKADRVQESVDAGGELLFADRAIAPLESDPETPPLEACRKALAHGIREIATSLFGWERMVAVDWRKAHATTLGAGLNDPIGAAKESK